MITTKSIELPLEYSSKHNEYLLMYAKLLSTANALDKLANCVSKKFGITHIQFNILKILYGAKSTGETITPGTINKRLMFSTSDLTRLLDRLEKKDLILRKVNPKNRREINIFITKDGEKMVHNFMPVMSKATKSFFKDYIIEEERDIIIRNLDIIIKNTSISNIKCLET